MLKSYNNKGFAHIVVVVIIIIIVLIVICCCCGSCLGCSGSSSSNSSSVSPSANNNSTSETNNSNDEISNENNIETNDLDEIIDNSDSNSIITPINTDEIDEQSSESTPTVNDSNNVDPSEDLDNNLTNSQSESTEDTTVNIEDISKEETPEEPSYELFELHKEGDEKVKEFFKLIKEKNMTSEQLIANAKHNNLICHISDSIDLDYVSYCQISTVSGTYDNYSDWYRYEGKYHIDMQFSKNNVNRYFCELKNTENKEEDFYSLGY